MARYVVTVGSVITEVPDDLGQVQDYVRGLVRKVSLEPWRRQALLQQVDNMPRAGMSFATDQGVIVKVERGR